MTLFEPATLITDYLLGGLAGGLAWRLHRFTPPANRARRWMLVTLLLTAASAFAGGTSHGFGPNLSPLWAAAWWGLTLATIHLVSAALALSWLHELGPVRWHRVGRIVIGAKLTVFATMSALHPVFLNPMIDYGLTMAAWLSAAAAAHRGWRPAMLTALALSGLAAAVQQLRLAPSVRFNHNDLYHVIQAFGLYAFYRAGRRLGGADSAAPNPA